MPKTPTGAKRPTDVIGNAVHVMRIATGQIEEDSSESARVRAGRIGGKIGGKARASKMTKQQRSASAKKAAKSRWKHR